MPASPGESVKEHRMRDRWWILPTYYLLHKVQRSYRDHSIDTRDIEYPARKFHLAAPRQPLLSTNDKRGLESRPTNPWTPRGQSAAFTRREAESFISPLTEGGASLGFKGELKILSMVCDKECLILLHRLRQFLKIGLSELSRQKICPAIGMHRILHHSLVVIR